MLVYRLRLPSLLFPPIDSPGRGPGLPLPRVYANIWERLQTTDKEDANIAAYVGQIGALKCLQYYFMTIHLMACYPTYEQGERAFAKSVGPCDKTWSTWSWKLIEKIYNLHHEIIEWPSSWANPDSNSTEEPIFIVTVDGMHCQIEEPTLESFNYNKKFFSHKFHSPALDYEIAISVFSQKCVWINGTFPAGSPDLKVFRQGLKAKIDEARLRSGMIHRGLADRGYKGEAEYLSLVDLGFPFRLTPMSFALRVTNSP